jgi:hypothetical protein
MIRPEQIPPEVVEAFVEAFHGKDMTRAAAIAAALNAWPGMLPVLGDEEFPRKIVPHDAIILPLTEGDVH